jgi:DNA polymerase III subunit delta'
MLIGHQRPRLMFLDAVASGRLHHAWLIAGPRGIGKRRFADWAALKLLAGESGELDTAADNPATSLVAAGSHPDHRVLSPPVEGKGSTTASIIVEQIREMRDFLHSFPAIADWRTLIVDSIDDMNKSTANAFLKELEEPRQKTVYFLISHSPARLLPTIRSRCRLLRLLPLSETETASVLAADQPAHSQTDLARLAAFVRGAPGRVAELAGADFAGLERTIEQIVGGADAMQLVRSVQPQGAIARFQALLALAPQHLAQLARTNPDPRLIDLYAEAEALAQAAVPLAYDRGQVAMAISDIMARAGRIQGRQ